MFSNCKRYNEEGSMIYDDAIKLQKVLVDKVKELGPLNSEGTQGTPAKKAIRTLVSLFIVNIFYWVIQIQPLFLKA